MKTLLLLVSFHAFAAHAEDTQYCEPPKYFIRARSMNMSKLLREPNLLTPEEQSDPTAGRRLAATPGPYGHSQLGFRYFARVFGYPGPFGGADEQTRVERWLALDEEESYESHKGEWNVWEKWVVNAYKRLPVPLGPVNQIPGNAGPEIFYRDVRDQASHARCIGDELDRLFCENSVGKIDWREDDTVAFRKPSSGGPVTCAYHMGQSHQAQRDNEVRRQSAPAGTYPSSGTNEGAAH